MVFCLIVFSQSSTIALVGLGDRKQGLVPLARNGQSVCHAQGKSVYGYKMCPYSGGKISEVKPRVIWLCACVRCFSPHRASAECIHLALDPFSLEEDMKSVQTRYRRSCERCVSKVYTFCYSAVGLKRGHTTFVADRSFSKTPVIKLQSRSSCSELVVMILLIL